jgi:hypothetical protein
VKPARAGAGPVVEPPNHGGGHRTRGDPTGTGGWADGPPDFDIDTAWRDRTGNGERWPLHLDPMGLDVSVDLLECTSDEGWDVRSPDACADAQHVNELRG